MAKNKDLSFLESESFYWLFILHDAAGTPLDLTGATVQWAVTSVITDGPSLLATDANGMVVITSATDGEGYVLVSVGEHAALVEGEYLHELRATLTTGVVTAQIAGRMTVGDSPFTGIVPDATRSTGMQLVYDNGTADANPGDGEFRFNNLTAASATFAYINLQDRLGVSIAAWLDALDDSTTTAARGSLRFTKIGMEATWYEFLITGALTTAVNYRKIPINYTAGAGTLTAGDNFAVTFARTGNTGSATESFIVACSDETTALTTGTAKATFRMPYAFTVTDVRASVTTAPTGATLLTVDVNDSGTTILSTKLTFDDSEKTTTTAATPRVISDTALADDAEITIDIDAVGNTIAGAGLKVYIIGSKT